MFWSTGTQSTLKKRLGHRQGGRNEDIHRRRKASSLPQGPGCHLAAAIRHFLKESVPTLNGDLICTPVVNELINLIDHYLPATERLRPGQVLWYGIAANETSGYGKRIEDCAIVPVLVDLISDDDIERYLSKVPKRQRQIHP